MKRLLLALLLLATPADARIHGGASSSVAPSYQGRCDVISGGCAEVWSVARAEVASYSGNLFQITNTTTSATTNIGQTSAHAADVSGIVAACGSGSTSGLFTVYSGCKVSKVYAQVQGSANDAVPSVFAAPPGPNCTAGGLTCACPLTVEIATGLPTLDMIDSPACEYTLVNDQNATGINVGTTSVTAWVDSIAQNVDYCCGIAGIGHAYNVADNYGTTFYVGGSYGQPSLPGAYTWNQCQVATNHCAVADEESIDDAIDYSSSGGNYFAMAAFDGTANQVSVYINGGQARSPITPGASLCHGCGGINLPGSVHIGGGGDLGKAGETIMRSFGFTNTAVSSADNTAAYSNTKTFWGGSLSFTDFTPPTTAVNVVQEAPGGSASGLSTTTTTTFFAPTGTGKRGVAVGLFWCQSTLSCSVQMSDVVISVTVGSNACTEVPNSFLASANGFMAETWVCDNLVSAGSVVTATASTGVAFFGIVATEISCPTSGCTVDQGGSAQQYGFYCYPATHAATAQSGEFLWSVGSTGGDTIHQRGNALNTSFAGLKDEWVATGPSGSSYAPPWLIEYDTGSNNVAVCSSAAIKP